IDLVLLLIRKDDLIVLLVDIDPSDILLLRHLHKCIIADLPHLPFRCPRHEQEIEHKQYDKNNHIIIDQRFSRFLYFLHSSVSPFSSSPALFLLSRALSAEMSACCTDSVAKSMANSAYSIPASFSSSSGLLSSE